MDYGKSGNPKAGKDLPRQKDPSSKPGQIQKRKGSTKGSAGPRPSKEELLERLKAAAEKKKAGDAEA